MVERCGGDGVRVEPPPPPAPPPAPPPDLAVGIKGDPLESPPLGVRVKEGNGEGVPPPPKPPPLPPFAAAPPHGDTLPPPYMEGEVEAVEMGNVGVALEIKGVEKGEKEA